MLGGVNDPSQRRASQDQRLLLSIHQRRSPGAHVHVYRDGRELGVFDLIDGPGRGLEIAMNAQLREALDEFISELNERGFFRR